MLLCICRGISENQARQVVKQGECSLRNLRCQTGLGTQCGICRKPAKQLIYEIKSIEQAGHQCNLAHKQLPPTP